MVNFNKLINYIQNLSYGVGVKGAIEDAFAHIGNRLTGFDALTSSKFSVMEELAGSINSDIPYMESMLAEKRKVVEYIEGTVSVFEPNRAIKSLRAYAFAECSYLTEFSGLNASSMSNVPNYAFFGCSRLSKVTLPKITSSIGTSAFCGCSALISFNVDTTDLARVEVGAFESCYNLPNISAPNLSYVGAGAFANCRNITHIDLRNVRSVAASAFRGCEKLKSISLSSAVSTAFYIGVSAFQSCYALSYVSIPGIAKISSSAFLGCSNLRSISMPNVTAIYSSAFANCINLSKVYIGTSNCTLADSNVFKETPLSGSSATGRIYVPSSYLSSYKTRAGWSYYSSIIVAG